MKQEQYAKYKRLQDRLTELNDLNGKIGRTMKPMDGASRQSK